MAGPTEASVQGRWTVTQKLMRNHSGDLRPQLASSGKKLRLKAVPFLE